MQRTGFVGSLTPEQEEALNELKNNSQLDELNAQPVDDHEALRFLRARNFDVARAKEMLVNYKNWYRSQHIYRYPAKYPPNVDVLADMIPHAFHGFDKEGHPIYIERSGMIDPPTLMSQLTDNEILMAHVWGQENQIQRCRESSERLGRHIESFTTIMDLKGMNMGQRACVKFTELITKTDQDNYPERLGYIIIVNPPFIFNFFWSIVKLWLDPVTKSKIIVSKGNFNELHRLVDLDQLPTRYGGTAEVPGLEDPDMPALRQKYLNDDKFKDNYKTTNIAKGTSYLEEIEVVPDFNYNYCFRCNEEVKFQAHFFPTGADKTVAANGQVITNVSKVEANKWPIVGTFCTELPGTMVLQWENDNWWGEKVVQFAYETIASEFPGSPVPTLSAEEFAALTIGTENEETGTNAEAEEKAE